MGKRTLLLLDLNGVLFYCPASSIVSASILEKNPGSCFVNTGLILRPWISEFLSFCFQHFEVGIWTSLQAKNAYPIIGRILGSHVEISHSGLILDCGLVDGGKIFPEISQIKELDKMSTEASMIKGEEPRSCARMQISILRHRMMSKSSVKGQLSLLWTQTRCTISHDGRAFKMKKDRPFMLKDLSSLWKEDGELHALPVHQIVEKIVINHQDASYVLSSNPVRKFDDLSVSVPSRLDIASRWSPKNTVLIDDSAYKFSQTPLNGIPVSSFDEDSTNDNVLLHLMQYLEKEVIALSRDKDDFDIREILKARPFSAFTPLNCV
ncbi:hypothetical protein MDAP_002732 [Mitosporidium daphniae]|uniref:Mitochondrial import inner membrane translocase subunit TIM50 n=1 Tax=Mitosporidium daphniae TaxID=1485682 RepID=A0A098VRT3_9MICR|nr:uncharacterized protein DI09_29p60 [Mitosporidium daphniae]KGG51685.1 hypothetical protein DI09_29p60 [Mitosporidium daphniae]|eukprot:XP_013238143.1 uncharacterized protein DI09_29p60 [Mitosporidium daphniae]